MANHLLFAENNLAAFKAEAEKLISEGYDEIVVCGGHDKPVRFEKELRELAPTLSSSPTETKKIICITLTDPEQIRTALIDYIDSNNIAIIAPITEYYFKNRPVYYTTIPKAGTHLLLNLFSEFGYKKILGRSQYTSIPGGAACPITYNYHTTAKLYQSQWFRTSEPILIRRRQIGASICLFLYRNPIAIFSAKKTRAAQEHSLHTKSKMFNMSPSHSIKSVQESISDYTDWINFPNVQPLSYEELVGEKGGGSKTKQLRLIWSLQLKLHVPGNPESIAEKLYDENSPTFNKGKTKSYQNALSKSEIEAFSKPPPDCMEKLGFSFDEQNTYSTKIEKFIKKVPVIKKYRKLPPLLIEEEFMGYNIVDFDDCFFALPQDKSIDLTKLDVPRKKLLHSNDLNVLKYIIYRKANSLHNRLKKWIKRELVL